MFIDLSINTSYIKNYVLLRVWTLNKINYHIELFANLPFHILLPCYHSQKVIGSARAFGNRYITQTLHGTGLPTKLNSLSLRGKCKQTYHTF